MRHQTLQENGRVYELLEHFLEQGLRFCPILLSSLLVSGGQMRIFDDCLFTFFSKIVLEKVIGCFAFCVSDPPCQLHHQCFNSPYFLS